MRTYVLFLPWVASTTVGTVAGFVATMALALWNASEISPPENKVHHAQTQTIEQAEGSTRKGPCETQTNTEAKTEGAMLDGYWTVT